MMMTATALIQCVIAAKRMDRRRLRRRWHGMSGFVEVMAHPTRDEPTLQPQ